MEFDFIDEDDELLDEGLLDETARDFGKKIKADPFRPGVVHNQALPEEVSEALEYLMFFDNYKEVTIKVVKGADNYSVRFEIINREK